MRSVVFFFALFDNLKSFPFLLLCAKSSFLIIFLSRLFVHCFVPHVRPLCNSILQSSGCGISTGQHSWPVSGRAWASAKVKRFASKTLFKLNMFKQTQQLSVEMFFLANCCIYLPATIL